MNLFLYIDVYVHHKNENCETASWFWAARWPPGSPRTSPRRLPIVPTSFVDPSAGPKRFYKPFVFPCLPRMSAGRSQDVLRRSRDVFKRILTLLLVPTRGLTHFQSVHKCPPRMRPNCFFFFSRTFSATLACRKLSGS